MINTQPIYKLNLGKRNILVANGKPLIVGHIDKALIPKNNLTNIFANSENEKDLYLHCANNKKFYMRFHPKNENKSQVEPRINPLTIAELPFYIKEKDIYIIVMTCCGKLYKVHIDDIFEFENIQFILPNVQAQNLLWEKRLNFLERILLDAENKLGRVNLSNDVIN